MLFAAVALAAFAAAPLDAAGQAPPCAPVGLLHVLIANPMVRRRVELAIQGAALRLHTPECQKLFTEFRDEADQPLQARLDALHQTGAGFLTWLRFADGDTLALCVDGTHIAAFTQPGSRVIQICGATFGRRDVLNAQAGEVVVIHELLHSLGLPENPPSAADISRRVLVRCGA
jgi:hypothetical protein